MELLGSIRGEDAVVAAIAVRLCSDKYRNKQLKCTLVLADILIVDSQTHSSCDAHEIK